MTDFCDRSDLCCMTVTIGCGMKPRSDRTVVREGVVPGYGMYMGAPGPIGNSSSTQITRRMLQPIRKTNE